MECKPLASSPLAVIFANKQKKGSKDDGAWVALARAEVRAWEQDPAAGHEQLRRACDAYRYSVDLLEPGFVQVL